MGKKVKQVSAATINRLLASFSAFFWYAVELDFIDSNPCQGIRQLKERGSRSRFFRGDEYTRYGRSVMAFINHLHAQILLLVMVLGLRPGEIKGLAKKHVFLADRMIFIDNPKNEESRFVPIGDTALEILRERLADANDSPWVFPAKSNSGHVEDLRKMHAKICKKEGIEGLQIRDLRRSHATMLRQSGEIDLLTIKEGLGHRSLTSTLVYTRVPSADLVAANNLADSKFQREILNDSTQIFE